MTLNWGRVCTGADKFLHGQNLARFQLAFTHGTPKSDGAVQVRFVHKKLQDLFSMAVSVSDQTLVYLDNSPASCEQQGTLGYPGMLGRSCRSDLPKDKCELFSLLCKQGYYLRVEKVQRYKRVNCCCRVIYCCKVECEEYGKVFWSNLQCFESCGDRHQKSSSSLSL